MAAPLIAVDWPVLDVAGTVAVLLETVGADVVGILSDTEMDKLLNAAELGPDIVGAVDGLLLGCVVPSLARESSSFTSSPRAYPGKGRMMSSAPNTSLHGRILNNS